MPPYDAVVLCGGASRRMGADKAQLVHDGRTLLQVAVDAVADARTTVCVGPRRAVPGPRWVREHPVGSGPVAALGAALPQLSAPVVVLLAADLPLVTPAAVRSLRAHPAGTAGWRGTVAVDDTGREQWLLSAWSVPALREAVRTAGSLRLRDVLGPLCDRRVVLPGRPWLDCDTPDEWADLRRTGGRARAIADGRVGRRGAA